MEELLMQDKKREISLTPGQAGELIAPILEAVLRTPQEQAQFWIGRKGKLASEIEKILNLGRETAVADLQKFLVQDLLRKWEQFFKEVFNFERDFSEVVVPEYRDGFDRLIVRAQNVTLDQIFKKCRALFPCQSYWENFEGFRSVRSADRDCAVWVRERVEADKELKGKSADDLAEEGIPCITLDERLLYELKFFGEMGGRHLDVENWTLCAGSCDARGGVPRVRWHRDKLRVMWCDPSSQHEMLRAREVVAA